MTKRNPQMEMLKKQSSAYGGELLKTRKGRSRGRPLDTKNTTHLVLRSSKAKGPWSFRKHTKTIRNLTAKFAQKNSVKILSLANVGNHLHFHIRLTNRHTYRPFIRGLTAAIAMAVTGKNRWTVGAADNGSGKGAGGFERLKFWDYRPYTRVVVGFRAFLNLKDYIRINQWEGFGYGRLQAAYFVKKGQFAENTA